MAVRIIGAKQATCTLRVLITLHEKGVNDFILQGIDFMNQEHKKSPHIDKNPFGAIPVLEDGDLVMFESRAICRYLALKYKDQGTPLMPSLTDIKAVAKFEQWASVETASFDTYVTPIFYQKMVNKNKGLPTSAEVLNDGLNNLSPKLDVLDKILSKQKYMGGDEFSLVDIFYVPYVMKLFKMEYGSMITDREYLNKWWQSVFNRPSVQEYAPFHV